MKRKKILYILAAAVLMMTGCTERAAESTKDTAVGVVNGDIHNITVEYGSKQTDAVALLRSDLSRENNGDDESNAEQRAGVVSINGTLMKVTAEPQKVDTSVLGDTDVVYTFSYDQNGKAQTQSEKVKITVRDTKAPVIHATHRYEIRRGRTFDPQKVIADVSDPVDGPLTWVSSEPSRIEDKGDGVIYESGWYTVSYNVNTSVNGTYSMSIHAVDKHGLTADDSGIQIIVGNMNTYNDQNNSSRYYQNTQSPVNEPAQTAAPAETPKTEETAPAETAQPEQTAAPESTAQPAQPAVTDQPSGGQTGGEGTPQ